MTIEQIKKLYDAQPFRPFVIHLADGREVPVAHRDFIATVPSGRILAVSVDDDAFDLIDLLLVTDVVVQSGRNGTGRHRRKRRST
jgi:hypothetical protein